MSAGIVSTGIAITRLDSEQAGFEEAFAGLIDADPALDPAIEARVRGIVDRVRAEGDGALLALTAELDGWQPGEVAELEVSPERIARAREALDPDLVHALEGAARRIRAFHERQRESSWTYRDDDGAVLGQKVTPLDRVGLYVPGGKASYPSSVLMNAIPAKVAGVGELIMTAPTPGGEMSDAVLAAASVAGVDRVLRIGGAQAVAAFAYGTDRVPRVDKVLGPGNIWVATAKRQVFGAVGIDMIAGPSEIVVLCDGHTPADWIAMDLFSQAEHDEEARAVLVSPDGPFLDRVCEAMERLLPEMERAPVIRASLQARGALLRVRDLEEGVRLVNRLAPEHLELSVEDPHALLDGIRHAGAIFLGRHACEALGDYCAGPNHVLPTSRTARFSSPLGVYDFQKRSSIIDCGPDAAGRLAPIASTLGRAEALTAHARSAEMRAGSLAAMQPRKREEQGGCP